MLSRGQHLGGFLAIVAIFVGSVLPHSWLASTLSSLGTGYVFLHFVLLARTGYLRRRPHWTPAAWRRYLLACSIPVSALLIVAWMLVALEWRLPIVGERNSPTRDHWAVASIVFLVIGSAGLSLAISWLAMGEPSRELGRARPRS